jgi:hypothetical protein
MTINNIIEVKNNTYPEIEPVKERMDINIPLINNLVDFPFFIYTFKICSFTF